MGAGGQDPVAYRQKQAQMAAEQDQFNQTLRLKQDEEARNRLTAFVNASEKNDFQDITNSWQGPLPEGASRIDLSPYGRGQAIMTPRPTTILPFTQDASGNLIPQAPINAPKGSKALLGARPTATSGGQPPKPPAGYRYAQDGNLEAIPGGPAEAKVKGLEEKKKGRIQGELVKSRFVIDKIDEALGNVGRFTTGIGGAVLKNVPGTSAYNLDSTLDTVRANVGFETLQEMRQNSPTGGALGQISDRENNLLQAVRGSMDQKQSRKQLVKNLKSLQIGRAHV